MSNLVKTILGELDKVALTYAATDDFQLENHPPSWFTEIWGRNIEAETAGQF